MRWKCRLLFSNTRIMGGSSFEVRQNSSLLGPRSTRDLLSERIDHLRGAGVRGGGARTGRRLRDHWREPDPDGVGRAGAGGTRAATVRGVASLSRSANAGCFAGRGSAIVATSRASASARRPVLAPAVASGGSGLRRLWRSPQRLGHHPGRRGPLPLVAARAVASPADGARSAMRSAAAHSAAVAHNSCTNVSSEIPDDHVARGYGYGSAVVGAGVASACPIPPPGCAGRARTRLRSFPESGRHRATVVPSAAPSTALTGSRPRKYDAGLPCIRRLVHDTPPGTQGGSAVNTVYQFR